jgi:sugar lactone lactonase YvrE
MNLHNHRLLVALCLLLPLAGCSSLQPQTAPAELPSWPSDQPRVKLERVIATRDHISGQRLGRWFAGGKGEPLFERPYGVAWDGDDLLVTDPSAGRVLRLGAGGRVTRSADGLLVGPIGVAACSAGIVVADARSGKVALLDRDLELVSWMAEGLQRPTGVACLGDRIFVVETGAHQILILVTDGSRTVLGQRGGGAGEYNYPAALSPAGDEALWVGDTLNFRLQQIAADSGEALASFGNLGDAAGETPRIKGIAVDAASQVWVSDAYLDAVVLYAADGTFLMEIGRPGPDPGELAFPAGIAAHPDGRVAVADSLNRRLQVFRLVQSNGGEHE